MDATNQPAGSARSRGSWLSMLLLAAVILVYVVLINTRSREPQGTVGPAIGKRLTHLDLVGLSGDTSHVTLDALRGKIALVNYWGTWCPPCVRELPQLEALAERFAGRDDFRLLAVSCGNRADENLATLREETERFLNARESHLVTYADPGGSSRRAMNVVLGIPIGYPTTVLLDREGRIRGLWQGYDPYAVEEMEVEIEKLFGQQAG